MATHQADKCISSIKLSLVDIEENEASFPNYASNNAYFRNENNVIQIPPETMQIPAETMQIISETIHSSLKSLLLNEVALNLILLYESSFIDVKALVCESLVIDKEAMQATPDVMEAASEDLITGTMQAITLLSEAIQTPLSEGTQVPLSQVLPCLSYEATQTLSTPSTQTPSTPSTQTPSEASFLNTFTQSKPLKRIYCESP